MATTASYLAFVLELLPPLWDVRSRKMFGEYMVYLNEKPVLLVCDNTVFVKKMPVLDDLMRDTLCGFPYEGAKEPYVLDVEDHEAAEEEISKEGAANAVPFAAYTLHVKGKLLYFWWCSLHTCE